MEIETKYGVDVWYSGSHVGMDRLFLKYKDANDQFILRIYWLQKDYPKDPANNNPRDIELTEYGYVRFKTKWEAECSLSNLKKIYPNHTCSIYCSDDWNYPFYICMARLIKKYDWRNKTLTSLGRTFEKEDEPTFFNKKAKITAKLNEVTKLSDLAFEVESSGK